MRSMLLAGDVGATKTLLGLFEADRQRPAAVAIRSFRTADFVGLGDVIAEFLREWPGQSVQAACFGVAGPVIGRRARLTNARWEVDAEAIQQYLGVRQVCLLNDMVALAWAVPVLRPDELLVLQHGSPDETGNRAVMAAGTGLGTVLLANVGGRFIPIPSEGGNVDFAARTPRELLLLGALTQQYGRARLEHVVSGPGIANIHRFAHPHGCPHIDPAGDPEEIPSLVTQAALERRCAACAETLETFVAAYGAAAGNLALTALSTGGVYLGGGIAPKILPALQTPVFLEAFQAKAPLEELLQRIPVRVILNAEAALLGAASYLADSR